MEKFVRRLAEALNTSRIGTLLALTIACFSVSIALGQDAPLCDRALTLFEAQEIIRQYNPGDNSIGLKVAVEKVICETGELRKVVLDQADLSDLVASDAHLYEVTFVDADLSNANLDGATIERGSLENTNLQGSSARGATFLGPNMVGTYWDCADFSNASFVDVSWRNVSGQSSNMRGVRFHRYSWESANFGFADLRQAKLFGYAQRSSNIYRANVSGTDLRIFDEFFGGELDQIFGGSGACYVEEDPPMDSLADDWMIQDGVYWRGEKLYLSICRDQTLNHTECQQ